MCSPEEEEEEPQQRHSEPPRSSRCPIQEGPQTVTRPFVRYRGISTPGSVHIATVTNPLLMEYFVNVKY